MRKTLLAAHAAFFVLAGCGIQRPHVDSVSDAIATTSSEIESIANEVQRLCGNTVPGGECAAGAVLSTDQKDHLRDSLQEALDAIVLANTALSVNDAAKAQGQLEQADALLRLIREELARRTQ